MTHTLAYNKTTLTNAHTDFERGLSSYSSFKVNNSSLSEDLVQDTFLKTWSYLVKGGEILKMKAFLYHILNGLIIDEYRKRKVASLDVLMATGYEPNETGSEIDKYTDAFDEHSAIQLISQLPLAYQEVMRMRYVQELTLDEMAKLSGKSKNSVAVQAHRGLEKLKTLYLVAHPV